MTVTAAERGVITAAESHHNAEAEPSPPPEIKPSPLAKMCRMGLKLKQALITRQKGHGIVGIFLNCCRRCHSLIQIPRRRVELCLQVPNTLVLKFKMS
jgi:hypothetical protein